MENIWAIERALWLEGAERFRQVMAETCLMVFPDPVGVLEGKAILKALEGAPRWAKLEIGGEVLIRPTPELAVLAYRAEARREGGPPYRALCSSTYLLTVGGWRIVQHQQTPLG